MKEVDITSLERQQREEESTGFRQADDNNL